MAPGTRRRSKGIGKGGTHSNDGGGAILSRPEATSSADARDGPTTRSSATTLGTLADAGVSAGASALANAGAVATATAQQLLPGPDSSALVPRADQTRDSSGFQQLMRLNADLSHQVAQLSEQVLVSDHFHLHCT